MMNTVIVKQKKEKTKKLDACTKTVDGTNVQRVVFKPGKPRSAN